MSILKQIAEGVALQEVSKALLGRYINKATDEVHRAGAAEIQSYEWDSHDDADAHGKWAKKRKDGIKTAVKKLTKEETEVELEEGNKANKEKKNIAVAKLGAKNSLTTKKHVEAAQAEGRGKRMADDLKREGRRALASDHHDAYRASYDRDKGHYNIVHRKSGRVVAKNVANSGGAAMSHADAYNKGHIKEEEQLDELSKGTLASYVDKAATDVHNNGFKAGEKWGQGGHKAAAKPLHKSLSRQLGIKKAVDKLAKEEVEHVEEEHMKKRGRPKKARHEDGKVVNDPEANS